MAQHHIVTAPLVIATKEDGTQVYLYKDAPVPSDLRAGELKRHLAGGMIAKAPDPAPEPPSGNGQGDGTDERIAAFLDRPAEDVIPDVPNLSDEDRAAAATAEEAGKKRVTVLRALTEPPSGNGQGDGTTPPQS